MASPMASMYSSTKAFLTNFAVSIAPELRREGIDVAVVHPSPTNTGFYAQAGAMSALKFFQKTAVGPCIIADSLFAAIGWHVVVDQGYFSVLSRLMLKVLDNNFMGEMMRLFTASGSGDFENVRKEGLAKMEKELKVE